jgi:HEAT repeat protein
MTGSTYPSIIWEDYKEARRNDRRTTGALIRLARAEQDGEKQQDLVEVLQYRGNREVLEAAKGLCAASEPAERVVGVWILGQNMVAEKTLQASAAEVLLQMLGHEESAEVLAEIGMSLGSLQDPGAVEPLTRLKNHPHADVRYGVVHGLFGQDDPRAVAALIELSGDVESDVRDWATFGLGTILDELDTPELREALAARLTDPHRDTRGEAMVGLALRKDQRVRGPLIAEIDSDDVGSLALEAASKLADPRLCPALLKLKADIGGDQELERALQSCNCAQNE